MVFSYDTVFIFIYLSNIYKNTDKEDGQITNIFIQLYA